MKHGIKILMCALLAFMVSLSSASAFSFGGKRFKNLTPEKGGEVVRIPVASISDDKAHYFRVKTDDGKFLEFFTVRSADGVIRVAVDACDVCYKAGRGYTKEGNVMVCENCGMRFPLSRINVVKGGCNPAPLTRKVEGEYLMLTMEEIKQNLWYMAYRR